MKIIEFAAFTWLKNQFDVGSRSFVCTERDIKAELFYLEVIDTWESLDTMFENMIGDEEVAKS